MTASGVFHRFLSLLSRHAREISQVIGLGCLATLLLAGNQSRLYRATERLQVVHSGIDQKYASSLVEGISDRQLQLVLQQVLSRDSITEIVDAYELFAGGANISTEKRVELLRNAVKVEFTKPVVDLNAEIEMPVLLISADLAQPAQAQGVAHEIGHRLMRFSTEFRAARAMAVLDFAVSKEAQLAERTQSLTQSVESLRVQTELSDTRSIALRRARISEWEQELKALSGGGMELQRLMETRGGRAIGTQDLNDGAIAELDTQVRSDRREDVRTQIQQARVDLAELATLNRQLAHMGERLQNASDHRAKAESGLLFETRRLGDRLVVIEPAILPERPIGDQKWFVFNGVLVSVLAALALAFLLDRRNPAISTARQMRHCIGRQPLVSIPVAGEKPV